MNFDTASSHLKKQIDQRIQDVGIWRVGRWTAVICQLKWGQIILSGKIHAHFLSEQWVAFFELFSRTFGLAWDNQGKVVILRELKTLWCQQNNCPHSSPRCFQSREVSPAHLHELSQPASCASTSPHKPLERRS